MPFILSLYYAIIDFSIWFHLADTISVPPPLFLQFSYGFQTYFPPKVYGTPPSIKTVSGFTIYARARGAPVGDRVKSYNNSYETIVASG